LGGNESITVDCRVITASKADCGKLAEARSFRSDFYCRIGVVSAALHALRDRAQDALQQAQEV